MTTQAMLADSDVNNSGNNIDLQLPAVLERIFRHTIILPRRAKFVKFFGDSLIYDPGHSSWINTDVSCCSSDDVIDDNLNSDMILTIRRIPTSSPSPPGSPSPVQPASE